MKSDEDALETELKQPKYLTYGHFLGKFLIL
jgi:hypothetical protein